MPLTKSFINTFILAVATLAMASCVPKATEKKAVCKANEAFNNKTRSCYSIAESRYVPVGSTSSASTTEETPLTVTLGYTDGNKDKAIMCRIVSYSSSDIEVMSPLAVNGTLITKADEVQRAISNLNSMIPAGAYSATSLAALTALNTALQKLKDTFYYPTLLSQMATLKAEASIVIGVAGNYPLDPSVKVLATAASARLAEYDLISEQVTNRCACSAGVCTTLIAPKLNKSGTVGFDYAITDIDGEGNAKGVTLTIAPMAVTTAHLLPVAESNVVTFTESDTSVASTTTDTFTLSGGADLNSTSMKYYWDGASTVAYLTGTAGKTTNGRVIGCMGFYGNSGTSDTTCTYIADNADNFATASTPASVTVDNITYTALDDGLAGNNISVQYFDINANNIAEDTYVTATETRGLLSGVSESFIRVHGDEIKVFLNPAVTTHAQIASLINNHPQAKKMVTASTVSTALPTMALQSSATFLAGGADAYDAIPIKVTNTQGATSTNTATIMVKMNSKNDLPKVEKEYTTVPLYSHAEAMVEDTAKAVSLKFKDIDDSSATLTPIAAIDSSLDGSCKTNMTTAGMTLLTAPGAASPEFGFTDPAGSGYACIAGAECTATVTITPPADFYGKACLYYYVTDSSATVSAIEAIQITVSAVNDSPTLTAIAAKSINEDLDPVTALPAFTTFQVSNGGGTFEASQTLSVTATSSVPGLVPSNSSLSDSCSGYTLGSASPIGAVVPTSTTQKYLDKTTRICYVSTAASVGSATVNDWKYYPSLTLYPICTFTSEGYGVPSGTPASNDLIYYDKTNNVCYRSKTVSGVKVWRKDPQVTDYDVAYIPVKDQSGATTITINATDDDATPLSAPTQTFVLTVNKINDDPVFITTPTAYTINTNEGGAVQSDEFKVDEDEGSTADEDTQGVFISSITSDNPSVLPVTAIKVFYDLNDNEVEDSGEARTTAVVNATAGGPYATFESADGNDVSDHNFYLKLDPVDGVSGNANLTLTISDNDASPKTKQIQLSFIVNPIAALHGGWNNITSIGLKTDKNGTPVSETDMVCNWNKITDTRKCGGAACTNSYSPISAITPDAENVIYWDSNNKRCYRSTGKTAFSWVELKTSCPVTRVANVCLDSETTPAYNNCIRSSTPVGVVTPATGITQYILDTAGTTTAADDTCYVSNGPANTNWEVFVPSKVTLSWKSFIMAGSGAEAGVQIAGWNIYRREKGSDFNFRGGHLTNSSSPATGFSTDSATRTFTDSTAIAGKVYYYVVRPVDSRRNFPTYTPESFSEVRLLAAPTNYAFVHRWIVNQEICNGMNITTSTTPYSVDQSNNFRCPYNGPGENAGYYDYGKDLLVDRQELGCAYAAAPKCGANGCVGMGSPNTVGLIDYANIGDPADVGILYYDREVGKCYSYTGTTVWKEMNDATLALTNTMVSSLRSALNAPLTNITQTRAAAICSTRSAPAGTGLEASFTAATATLPSKKDYNAYASQRTDKADAEITEIERGLSLTVQSRCNGSEASGLESDFIDADIPSTSFIYTLAGTASSGIKSLYTGSVASGNSKGTEECVSRFGIQDLYGNVAEWTTDKMECKGAGTGSALPDAYVCTSHATASYAAYDFDPSGTTKNYAFDLLTGPYSDNSTPAGAEGLDAFLTSWTYANENFNAGKFSYPLGLPINNDIATVYPTSTSLDWLLDIGSGISSNKLHEDGMIVNGVDVWEDPDQTGAFAVGGSYLSGTMAGRYTSELVPAADVRPDVGARCIIPINNVDYPVDTAHPYRLKY